MDIKNMTQQVRLAHWAGVIKERNESGKTIRAWCKENDINEKTYYYWQRKLRQIACEQLDDYRDSQENKFTEVMLPEEPAKAVLPQAI